MSGAGNARILVVDDVPKDARLLDAVLAARGYDVVSATDGRAALELVESAKPDLAGPPGFCCLAGPRRGGPAVAVASARLP